MEPEQAMKLVDTKMQNPFRNLAAKINCNITSPPIATKISCKKTGIYSEKHK